jgi:tetratricopeptide (TPR) repeat protein
MVRAATEMNRSNFSAAIDATQPAMRFELGNMPGFSLNYVRGQIYLRAKMGNEAVGEFRKIIDHQGVDPTGSLYPLAHLGLARALILTGDLAGARKEYQDFLAIWKDADADLPILIEAKKEYEQLKQGS